jgi:integrase
MATIPSSLDQAGTLTLADIHDRIRHDPAIGSRRRQEEMSALKRAATVLGMDFAQLPATSLLMRRLAEACPLRQGIQPRRWSNIRSLVACAIARYVRPGSRRGLTPLSPAWRRLANLAGDKFEPIRVSQFMRFCSARGIAPEQVGQSTFDDFRVDLREGLRKDPEQAYWATVANWNRYARSIPGWHAFQATPPEPRKTLWTLPWSSFPELSASKDRWLKGLDGSDPLGDRPVLRPRTIRSMDYMMREAASALVLQGCDAAGLREVSDLASLQAFKSVLRYMLSRRGNVPGGHLVQVAWLLKAIATHTGHAPKVDIDEMRAVIGRMDAKLRAQQPGMTRTNRSRLRPFDDPETVRLLLTLPQRLVREATRPRTRRNRQAPQSGRAAYRAARLVMMAVAIELLLMAPMRIKNLAELDLEEHFTRLPDGQVWIAIPGREVKNEQDLDYPLPGPSVELLNLYLGRYRPVLVKGTTSTALFPSPTKGFRRPADLGIAIKTTIGIHTGLIINPHLFRHIGSKLYLDMNPGAYEVLRQVLGHTSATTTRTFYVGMETAAIRHYHANILRLRGSEPMA